MFYRFNMKLVIHQPSVWYLLWQQRPEPLPFLVSFPGAVLGPLALVLLPHRTILWVVLQPVAESLTGLPVQWFVCEADRQRHQSSQVVVLKLDASNGEKVKEKKLWSAGKNVDLHLHLHLISTLKCHCSLSPAEGADGCKLLLVFCLAGSQVLPCLLNHWKHRQSRPFLSRHCSKTTRISYTQWNVDRSIEILCYAVYLKIK